MRPAKKPTRIDSPELSEDEGNVADDSNVTKEEVVDDTGPDEKKEGGDESLKIPDDVAEIEKEQVHSKGKEDVVGVEASTEGEDTTDDLEAKERNAAIVQTEDKAESNDVVASDKITGEAEVSSKKRKEVISNNEERPKKASRAAVKTSAKERKSESEKGKKDMKEVAKMHIGTVKATKKGKKSIAESSDTVVFPTAQLLEEDDGDNPVEVGEILRRK